MGEREVVYIGPQGHFRHSEGGSVPVPADMPGVTGVFLGGCVARGVGTQIDDRSGITAAHAHTHTRDPHRGWVCFQNPEFLKLEWLRMHELAHITTGQGHTDAWRAEMTRLGQPIPPRYQRRGSRHQACS